MKKAISVMAVTTVIFSVGLVSSCANSSALKENPYKDDYSDVSLLSMRDQWGPANVHDPSVIKTDSFYYVYSTDAYYMEQGVNIFDTEEKVGNIPIRRSKDLIHWEFVGWALDSIPLEAIEHIHALTNNKGAENIWAPYILKYKDTYRLYYSVSSFGANTSFIGLAESASPEGPWEDKGVVVKSDFSSPMNAIDASVVTDADNDKMWMHYGSYFDGLYCVELDPENGKTIKENDLGHLVATRAQHKEKIIEAPEVIYHPDLKQYYLFVSYEPLFTYYNIRVGRSDHPQGPFYDYFGNDMADTTNNYPILTHSYMFDNHPGWSGNGHCAVLNDNGQFYLLHQGRLAPDNLMMTMHVREMKWLSSGWPVVSPERLAEVTKQEITSKQLLGKWEVIHLKDLKEQTKLWQGQIPAGGWKYNRSAFNISSILNFDTDGSINDQNFKNWSFDGTSILIDHSECAVFNGWDWENQRPAILFSGILLDGTAIWGKKLPEIAG